MAIRVLIADDHALLREGLKTVLEFSEDIKVVAEAIDGEDTLEKLSNTSIDVLLLDVNMPKLDGMQVLESIRKTYLTLKVIVLTMHDDENYLHKMILLGADGYLLKGASSEMLVEAIRVVHAGDSYIYPTLAKKLLNISAIKKEKETEIKQAESTKNSKKNLLSAREIEVLQLVANGHSNFSISQSLFLSEKTVKNHMTNIFRKLDVYDRTQAVLKAIKDGIVSI